MDREVCPNSSRNCLDGFFFRFADLATVDHHIVLAGDAIDPDGTEGNLSKRKVFPASRALFRRDDGKGGPALLDFLASAFRAHDVALLSTRDRTFEKSFLHSWQKYS
jgi:hypothetical protein